MPKGPVEYGCFFEALDPLAAVFRMLNYRESLMDPVRSCQYMMLSKNDVRDREGKTSYN